MKFLCSVLLGLIPLLAWAEDPVIQPIEIGMVEKKKTIIKLFDVDDKDNLLIDNQFGGVTIGLWNKNEIRIQITITANSDSDERVQRYLDAVSIEEKRTGNQIVVRTHFSQSVTSNWNVMSWKSDGERNYVKINYEVMMPKQTALSVRNKFGNTVIPSFHAPLTVHNRHGNFSANDLTNHSTDLNIAYGKAIIKAIDQGKLAMAYGNLDLNRANVLTLTNQSGKMHIGEVGRLDANIDYSGATIGTVRESCKIKLNFSGGFRIDQLPKSADNIDIQASYSSVSLPINSGEECDFDVTVSYGNFHYSSASSIHFKSQPTDDGNRGPRLTKQYIGKIGNGSGPKIRVTAKFGNVNF